MFCHLKDGIQTSPLSTYVGTGWDNGCYNVASFVGGFRFDIFYEQCIGVGKEGGPT